MGYDLAVQLFLLYHQLYILVPQIFTSLADLSSNPVVVERMRCLERFCTICTIQKT